MAGNDYEFPYEIDAEQETASSHRLVSIEQLQRLVRALDNSDVSELELQREADGMYLALRKVKASEMNVTAEGGLIVTATNGVALPLAAEMPAPKEQETQTEHKILAPLVGTFHVWAKPRGGTLVAVGDRVKAGQLVGTHQLTRFDAITHRDQRAAARFRPHVEGADQGRNYFVLRFHFFFFWRGCFGGGGRS